MKDIEGIKSVKLDEFIKQDVDGILYEIYRLEEVILTFTDDPKWINDFASTKIIRKLKEQITELEKEVENERKRMDVSDA